MLAAAAVRERDGKWQGRRRSGRVHEMFGRPALDGGIAVAEARWLLRWKRMTW